MRVELSPAEVERSELRLRFRRIPDQSCVIEAFAEDAADSAPLARAYVYGRGEGSSAQEQLLLALRFREGTIRSGQSIVLRATGLAGQPLSKGDLELLERV